MFQKTILASTLSLISIFVTVCFAYNSSELNSKTCQDLDKIVSQLDSLLDYTIHLSGHTDNTGTNEHNEHLSKRRVIVVKNYLISKNVDSTKITCDFYGEQKPAVPNTSEENMALNRRVEITVKGEKTSPERDQPIVVEPDKQEPVISRKKQEEHVAPAKQEVKKKKVRRRLVWTGWRTGFHWSTAGK